MKEETSFALAYNFILIKELGNIYIPSPFVASVEKGALTYYFKKATNAVLENSNLAKEDDVYHKELLSLCADISLQRLQDKYVKNLKKNIAFEEYVKDQAIRQVVLRYINIKRDRFFELILKHKPPVFYFQDKNQFLGSVSIELKEESVVPLLHFKRTEEGVYYSLKLQVHGKCIAPEDAAIFILYDKEGYFCMDGVLCKLKYINAKKLLPFLNKQSIFVPKRTELMYFEKFVLGVSNNLSIETEGFEVCEINQVTACRLFLIHHFLRDELLLRVQFFYGKESFYMDEQRQVKTAIAVEGESLKLYKTSRNKLQESHFISKLEDMGFQEDSNNYFGFSNDEDSYAIVNQLVVCKTDLELQGFEIVPFEVERKNLSIEKTTLEISASESIDWFDVKAVVVHGEYRINFIDLKSNIIAGDRFYKLPNNQFFIIPIAWMERYKPLFLLGKITNQTLLLSKSQYPVLEFLDLKPVGKLEALHPEFVIPTIFKATLRDYQKLGVIWLLEHHISKLGACLADDMGLGKTIQTIAVLCYAKQELIDAHQEVPESESFTLFSQNSFQRSTPLCALLVLPASLVFNWKNELKKFAPSLNVIEYRGPSRKKIKSRIKNYDVILTTYQTALRDIEHFETLPLSYLVLDESQYIKNNNSKVFKAINSLKPVHKISLSGTPIENSLSDLWSQMEFINNGLLGTYASFKKQYQIPIESTKNEGLITSLKNLIAPYILRRSKEEVLKDLPALNSQIFYVDMSTEQQKLYDKEKSLVRNQLLNISSKNKLEVLKEIMRLRQLSNHPVLLNKEYADVSSGKFMYVTAYLDTLIKANKKILVFSSFVSHLSLYENWSTQQGIQFCTLTGSTQSSKREEVVKEFQENKAISIFFVSLKAGGTGLNLTAASYVVILDPWWNPFAEKQAVARAHRMGQEQKVHVARFVSRDTLEEKIITLQERKKELSGSFLDDFGTDDISLNDVMELL